MRKISYEKLKECRSERVRALLAVENTFQGRAAGRRFRDPEKEKLLAEQDRARMRRYIESGKLEVTGPRKWKWRIDIGKSP